MYEIGLISRTLIPEFVVGNGGTDICSSALGSLKLLWSGPNHVFDQSPLSNTLHLFTDMSRGIGYSV